MSRTETFTDWTMMAVRRRTRRPDASDAFVHSAVRAFATGSVCPPPPADPGWIERAAAAGVIAPVADAARAAGHTLPLELTGRATYVAAWHLRTLRDLRGMADTLDAAGIVWAVMKGPALRSIVFVNPAVRDYADLDLLVSPSDIRRAVNVLVESGCTLGPVDWSGALRDRTAEVALVMPGGTHLDLHWGLINFGNVRDGYRLDTGAFLRRRRSRRVDGVDLVTLDDADLALHTMLHASTSGAHSLRWLLDVQQCVRWLERTGSRDVFAARAREHGLEAPTRSMIATAARYVDPGLRAWCLTGGRASVWTACLDHVSRRRPPSSPSLPHSSAHSFFTSTRSTTPRSVAAFAARGVKHLRYRRSGWPQSRPEPTSLDDPGLEAWLTLSETTGSHTTGDHV